MRQQYGLRVNSEEFRNMSWLEFSDLLSGLNEETPLVKVAQIRTETDAETLKQFTPAQRRMRAEWQRSQAAKVSERDRDAFVSMIQAAFAAQFSEGR